MTEPAQSPVRGFGVFLLGTAAFAAVCMQAPLWYSNQNQYFVHGLASAGEGQLADDWLASTRDPTPVFSALVTLTVRLLHPWAFHVYYALVQGAYAAAMLGLFVFVAGKEVAARRWPIFVALFLLVHSALLRWASYRLLGQDYPWYFQAGLAGQYILGAMFQPSTFGVLLVVAICLFVRGRPFLAGGCVAVCVTVHSTYLLAGAMVTLGFLTALCLERRSRTAFALAAWTLALVLPVVVYVLVTFRPTSAESFAAAQDILANFRIPHHTRPDLWLDRVAGVQIAWIVLSLVLVWRTRLFVVLVVPFVLAALLTLAQALTGSDTLSLLFPWRLSAVLVPIATAVVLSRLVLLPVPRLESPLVRAASAVLAGVLLASGLWIIGCRQAFVAADEELGVLSHVRQSRERGDLYFIPVEVPNLVKATRGSLSSDFKPLPDKKADPKLIPVNLQRFRLTTGAPIFVDFKSIPYLDTDVIEWRERVRAAQAILKDIEEGRETQALAELRKRGVTHLVVRAAVKLPALQEEYQDPFYRVYRLAP